MVAGLNYLTPDCIAPSLGEMLITLRSWPPCPDKWGGCDAAGRILSGVRPPLSFSSLNKLPSKFPLLR